MLSDRPYLRDAYPRRRTSVTIWLVAALVAAYLVELLVLSPWFGTGGKWLNGLTLTVRGVQSGQLWTLATHSLLHGAAHPLHLLFTVLSLVFLGRELEPALGPRRLLAAYAGAVVAGGLCWTATHWAHGGVHLGASAGVAGLFVILAGLFPRQEVNFLVFFLIPVRLRPIHVVYALLAADLFLWCLFELPAGAAPFGLAPSAHLGGMLAGWVYFRFWHANNGWDRRPGLPLPAWLRRRPKPSPPAPRRPSDATRTPGDLRAEVDRILDKINSEGFGALSEEEKRVLDAAKDLLSRN
ncbi:MAG: rhomboid family intramembrane serine protease [Opitutaceae bacterium]|nr:rhomboid family intramembrane serine protease [Opitutaceae bacterium]